MVKNKYKIRAIHKPTKVHNRGRRKKEYKDWKKELISELEKNNDTLCNK